MCTRATRNFCRGLKLLLIFHISFKSFAKISLYLLYYNTNLYALQANTLILHGSFLSQEAYSTLNTLRVTQMKTLTWLVIPVQAKDLIHLQHPKGKQAQFQSQKAKMLITYF